MSAVSKLGNDALIGGLGKNTLLGGSRKDTFVYSNVREGGDRIRDFKGTEDLIDLRGIFRATQFSGDNRFAQFHEFIQLVQVGSGTEVRIDADGSGSGTAFTTLATLQKTVVDTVDSTNFVIR